MNTFQLDQTVTPMVGQNNINNKPYMVRIKKINGGDSPYSIMGDALLQNNSRNKRVSADSTP